MNKDISKYLHYYLGQKIQDRAGRPLTLSGQLLDDILRKKIPVKPILRKLEDITDEELKERLHSSRNHYQMWLNHNQGQFPTGDLLWFLENGFDVFDLIREGLAVDKATIKS